MCSNATSLEQRALAVSLRRSLSTPRFRSREGAHDMRHRERQMEEILERLVKSGEKLDEIGDIYEGSEFWDAYCKGHIGKDDVRVMFSMDGAQLFEHKASNCWIYIWILIDVALDKRYKKKYILPGAIVPGPHKPKCIEVVPLPWFPTRCHAPARRLYGVGCFRPSSSTLPRICSVKLIMSVLQT